MPADDPETMERMRRWLRLVAEELGLDPAWAGANETTVLRLIRRVAHGPSRPGAPLTAFLLGVAAGQGGDPPELAERVAKLTVAFDPRPDSGGG